MLSEIKERLNRTYTGAQLDLALKACEYAAKAHKDQRRKSGEPYIVHPIGVVNILMDMRLDVKTVCASFLHDVVEDTPATEADIRREFGDEVSELVKGVTKLEQIKFKSEEEEQAENFRNMFLAMAKDIRVLIIKLADRLHNMRTISALAADRKYALAKETLEIYAPLASRLGLSYIKCELEDLCLKTMHPAVYESIAEEIKERKAERQEMVAGICAELRAMLAEMGIRGDVSGRPKHFYSIYKKMLSQSKSFAQLYDLTAVRVVVETVTDCYEVLGKIHTMWKPMPGRFKDYIAVPKQNNYQSLHTTVMTNYGSPFEIQIRTFDMHKIAEYGIAAHWMYKENRNAVKDFDNKINWLRSTLDLTGDLSNSKEFLESLKLDLYSGQVFVFTPRGDVLVLAEGSTPVDFAYSVHTNVGNKCVSAKINGRMVPLSTKLQNGDYVEILTSPSAKGPSRDWLKFVQTAGAKAKIRNFFKKAMVEENIKLGRDMIEAESKRKGYQMSQLLKTEWVEPVLSRFSLSSVEDMYAAIGYGGISVNQVLLKLIDFYKKDEAKRAPVQRNTNQPIKECKNGVIIKGYDDLLVRLARCCTPIPGDDIVGFISRGRGVVIHRMTCPNLAGLEPERMIEASWANKQQSLSTNLTIVAVDSHGLLASITALMSEYKISIGMINARLTKQQEAFVHMGITVEKSGDVDFIMKKLEMLPDVKSVRRS